jgi:hypothetical protein
MKLPLFALVLLLSCSSGTLGQSASPSPNPSPPISLQDYRSILENERKLLDEQSEKYYTRIDTLINRSLWVFGIIFSAAAAIFLWQYGKTKSELKSVVRQQFQEQAASLIDQEMTALRNQVQNLNQQVEALLAANNQPVLWIFSGTETDANEEREALIDRGIRDISLLTPAINEDFEIGDPALVIFSYDRSAEGHRRLTRIAELLRERAPATWLIIYTYGRDRAEFRLGEPERRVLGDFLWYMPANYPVTLIAQTQLLLHNIRAN